MVQVLFIVRSGALKPATQNALSKQHYLTMRAAKSGFRVLDSFYFMTEMHVGYCSRSRQNLALSYFRLLALAFAER